jgi:hypothetical protein
MKRLAAILLLAACATAPKPAPATAPNAAPAPASTITTEASRTAKMQRIDGFIPLFWDDAAGKLFMLVERTGEDFIDQVSLPAGVGSNPIGLDRGELGGTRLVRFERVGPKVLLVEQNTRFRALSNDPAERRDVEDSFAKSVLWSFKVEGPEAGGVLVDATDFFLSDQHGVVQRMRDLKQGSYSLDRDRSAIYLPRTKAFPRNTEVEATLTFVTRDRPGRLVGGVTPSPEFVTVREHHSLVALPEPGYTPRRLDPRIGIFGVEFMDYASPFAGPVEKRWVARHRLEKRDPNAAVSEAVKPLVYYVDNGVPEPIRSALIEGASWWNTAFEAAGFRNAWQVKVLPPDADPMDVRYNMINWVHRSSRGWSYGEAVIDPRTGEIIKGNVRLGSLRIRQDVLIARGLIPQYGEIEDEVLAQLDPKTSPSVMALQRIRQLAAHEVGHTLGLDHNMAASSYGRASVMDYPSPYVKITNGKLDLSEAYTNGLGIYDIFAIRYGYSQFAPGTNEEAALTQLVDEAEHANPPMLYVKDADARPVSAAHPLASVWDVPGEPIAMLRHEMEVRRIALSDFGLRNLAVGESLSTLEEKLLPLYLHHRFQLEAAAKSIGGLFYTYAVKEKSGIVPSDVRRVVAPAVQRDALAAVMAALEPKFLAIPQRIIDLIPPRSSALEFGTAELFERKTAPVFDPLSAATVGADLAISALLEPHRAARMVAFHAENAANPDFHETLDALLANAMRNGSGNEGAITRVTRAVLVTRLEELAADPDVESQVRAEASEALFQLQRRLEASASDFAEQAHRRATRDEIARFLARPAEPRKLLNIPELPPGPPI